MEYFFVYDKYLPQGVGISLFGPEHICWLGTSVLSVAGLCAAYKRVDNKTARRMLIAVAGAVIGSELLRTVELLRFGLYTVYQLPLHLCGLAVFLTAWHTARGGDYTAETLYAVCMPGAAAALLFPDWIRYPAMNLISIDSFIAHILLVAYPLMLLARGQLNPNPKRLLRIAPALALTAVPIYAVNRVIGANYMYLIRPAPGSPLEFFENILGNPGYILGYIPILAGIWLVLYLPLRRSKPKIYGDKNF